WRADEASFGETRVEGGPSWALAVALPVWGRREARVEFLGEVAGELTTELQLGVRGRYREWIVTASGGPGLSDDDVTPDYRLLLSAAYRGGSPDARDADGDGLDDDRDGCPAQPEDVDGFQDDDGCPDPDNDGDGVADAHDACPLAAEDIDRFEDGDGCPDADNDGDGIVDAVDACPLSPEDRDGYGDADGCPEADNDGDGIVDERDRCPLDPEDPDGELDEDGCPDVKAAVRVDVVVFFARDQDTLSPEAKVQLDRVAHSLIAMPDALHVWINGHADDTGRAEHNQQLGMRRAEAVRQYLLERGVPAERMTAQSYGDTKNVFAGDSDEDRLANRHVDFRVGPRTLSAPDSAQPPAGGPSAQEPER
ncbi:MAG: OmpA family protein, partial [Myxococcales bacterium]